MSERNELGNPVVAESLPVPRRRRLVHGIGAGVLTVSAQSALAQGTCLSPSAQASIVNFKSRPNRPGETCIGRTPGYWKNAKTTPAGSGNWSNLFGTGDGPLFSDVFGSGFPGRTIRAVMLLSGGPIVDPFEFGAHLSAAYCNFLMGWVPNTVLNLDDLKKMWTLGGAGNYEPVPGIFWGPEKIVAYLKSTMTL